MASSVGVISIPVDLSDVTLKIELTGVKRLRARMWIGGKLMVFAAWVMGCAVEIMDNTDDA